MAKLSSIEKNNRRKRNVQRDYAKRLALKEIIKDKSSSPQDRFKAVLKLASMPRNGASVRVRNRCELTGRARGYHREFKLSRICLRTLANQGKLPGVRKASW